ncbi:hypothetical protein [Acinetobacter baumannii]|uniref:hypothetical protein n=1 Tax=Acinetobacter baumannii TaxID=470 RepID=UPI003F1AD1C9
MSEFKVGDYIVIDQKYDKTFMPVLQIISEGKNYFYCNDGQVHKSQMEQWRKAEPEEIALGCRIDMPSLPEPVGSLQELHPEFAKVLHENFLELIGDDFPIENHISPNCKVTEAHINEADKLNRLG